ncbi:MAG: endolytic transglycosylase MltG, partial [Chloroflexota bacterium]
MSSFRGIVGLATVIIAILLFGFLVMVGWRAVSSPQALLNDVLSQLDGPADPDETEQKVFVIQQGETAGEIAERLKSEGLISDSLLFRLRIEIEGVAGDLSAGEYELSPSMKPSEILDILVKGEIKQSPLVTIPEGWRSEEIAARLAERGVGSADQFMQVVKDGRSESPLLSS